LVFIGCGQEDTYELQLPSHFPKTDFPSDNEPTTARVALGKKLFFDTSVSLDSTLSCQSCHLPERAFTDGNAISPGIHARLGNRNAPTLLNVAYLSAVNKDGGVRSLDLQALVPIEDENEMGISILRLSERLNQNPEYVQLAEDAYGQPINAYVVTRALASFIRTLYSGNSPYDQYITGDSSALSDKELRGKQLFESERLNCTACHSGFNFTDNSFENNGLYQTYKDVGRMLITQDSADLGKFRVPTLRNISITAPYMHDGSLSSLEEVIGHYEKVGQDPTNLQSKKLKAFNLNAEEKEALIAFLKALREK